ncbi:MAG: response regulator [bacterium]
MANSERGSEMDQFFSGTSLAHDEAKIALMSHCEGLFKKTSQLARFSELAQSKFFNTQQELKQALEDLQQAQERLLQQERLTALGRMARGMAHGFNNFLQPIMLAGSMLASEGVCAKGDVYVRKYANVIVKAAQEAAHTVKQLSRFYRPSATGEAEEIDVRELVQEVVDFTRPRWKDEAQARGCSVEVHTDFQSPCFVKGSREELSEALVNIVFNAVEAIQRKGSVIFSTRCEGAWAVIEVKDTGAGMKEAARANCLEPFYTTKLEKGSGLGLSVAYGIIKGHKGTLEVMSQEGKGTTVRLCLPSMEKRKEGKSVDQVLSPPLPNGNGHVPSRRILVVDDEEPLRSMLAETLERDGHKVMTAFSGSDGWKKVQKENFDVVITDQAMLGMTGELLAKRIKEVNPSLPVIMLTGFGDLMKESGREPKNVDLLLSKPIEPQGLRDALKRLKL